MKPSFSRRAIRAIAIGGALAFASSLIFGAWTYATTFGADAPTDSMPRALAIDVGLLAAFALHHSILARAGLKHRVRIRVGTDIERSLYVWIASILFFLMTLCWKPVPGVFWRADATVAWLLAALQITGAGLMVVAVRLSGFRDLTGLRALDDPRGRHTPAVASRGPYGVIRHPLYLAFLLLLWPVRVMTGSRLLFAGLLTIYVLVAIPLEERDLRGAFGKAYDQYAQRVRFRLLPWVY
jgi:protein-S-isoprenylcysteine O-methyltransferase Ste14